MKTGPKSERVACRFTPDLKRRLEMAALLRGQTVTGFVESIVSEKANQVLEEHRRLELSERDARTLYEALLNPPQPSDSLKRDMQEYVATREAHPELGW